MKQSKLNFFFLCIVAIVVAGRLPAVTPETTRILIIDPFGHDIPPFSETANAFREALANEIEGPVDFSSFSLDLARKNGSNDEKAFIDFLQDRYENHPPDLVAAIGSLPILFVWRNAEVLFPGTPVLGIAGSERLVLQQPQTENHYLIAHKINLDGVIEDILQLAPETKTVAVTFGSSDLENYWVAQCKRDFEPFSDKIEFVWLNGLPLAEVVERCANLPPDSFILHTLYVVDGAGVPFQKYEALKRIKEKANAPVFSYFESSLGLGAVGGRLYQDREMGVLAARAGLRILREDTEGLAPVVMMTSSKTQYDWRELKRWKIPESQLPSGSEILFQEPTFYEEHFVLLCSGILFILFQSILILGLLINRKHRIEAEEHANILRKRLVNANEAERSRLARELHDDINQQLASIAIDAGEAGKASSENITSQSFSDIQRKVISLSKAVHNLSHRLHSTVLDDLGLEEAIQSELGRYIPTNDLQISFHFALNETDRLTKETSLCLYRIIQEALQNIHHHAEADNVYVRLEEKAEFVELMIRDDGKGFDPGCSHVTKGLGLTSMRERTKLLKGKINFTSQPEQGTTIEVQLPLIKTYHDVS